MYYYYSTLLLFRYCFILVLLTTSSCQQEGAAGFVCRTFRSRFGGPGPRLIVPPVRRHTVVEVLAIYAKSENHKTLVVIKHGRIPPMIGECNECIHTHVVRRAGVAILSTEEKGAAGN